MLSEGVVAAKISEGVVLYELNLQLGIFIWVYSHFFAFCDKVKGKEFELAQRVAVRLI